MDFDSQAAIWDTQRRRARAKALAGVIRQSWGERPEKALDFGCGTGLLTFELFPFAGEIAGYDASDGMGNMFRLKMEAAGAKNVRFLTESEMERERFDVIFSSMVLHHIRDVGFAIRRLRALLAPGGRFVWIDIDKDDGTFHRDEPDFDGHDGFERDEARALLSDAGFRDVTVKTAYEGVRDVGGVETSYSMFVAVAR
jgi:ubiquinone/menaquinone biosynthesis C-methylase UbiE